MLCDSTDAFSIRIQFNNRKLLSDTCLSNYFMIVVVIDDAW